MKTNSITRKFGKMLRLDVTFGKRIEQLKITGDFFLHPEDTLEKIVEKLTDISLPFQKDKLVKQLNLILEQAGAELIGISAEDIVSVLEEAVQ